jgi:hypothetical protein
MSGRRINTISDDSSSYDSGEDLVTEIQPVETVNETITTVPKEVTKPISWVYEFARKLESNGSTYFHCRCEFKNEPACKETKILKEFKNYKYG